MYNHGNSRDALDCKGSVIECWFHHRMHVFHIRTWINFLFYSDYVKASQMKHIFLVTLRLSFLCLYLKVVVPLSLGLSMRLSWLNKDNDQVVLIWNRLRNSKCGILFVALWFTFNNPCFLCMLGNSKHTLNFGFFKFLFHSFRWKHNQNILWWHRRYTF